MSLKQLKKTRSRWSILSKVDQLGAIDFWTLTISLDSLNPKETLDLSVNDLKIHKTKIFDFPEYERRKKVLTLVVHEYTHFVDITSSLWGMHHLNYINSCHSVNIKDENEYFILKNSFDYMRSIRLPQYYTTIDRKLSSDRPWRSQVSSGVTFSSDGKITDRPIIFVNFFTAENKRLVRSPLSVVSLLEASAMAKEIEIRFLLISHLPEKEKIVEYHLLKDELIKYIYNPEITEYSACFHLLANIQNEADLLITSKAVGILSRVILNAPAIAFKTASKNVTIYAKIFGLSQDSLEVKRIKSALEQNNRGALFFLVAVLLPKNSLSNEKGILFSIEKSLKLIGLNIGKIRRGALEEAKNIFENLSTSDLPSMRIIVNHGYDNFKKIFPFALHYPLEMLSLPPSLHGDDDMTLYKFHSGKNNKLKDFNIEEAYDELVECQLRAENFAEGCI